METTHATTAAIPVLGPLTRDMLSWLAGAPRTYAETMDAWRSSCPRLTIWEDALADGLVRVEDAGASGQPIVAVTALGRTALDGTR